MKPERVKIEHSWKQALWSEFEQPYFDNIKQRLFVAKNSGLTVYPPGGLIFNAFKLTPLDKVKVVIIGQDPYHNPGEAMGLSFSVPMGVRVPPSLRNVFKELHADIGIAIPNHGNLTPWAEQGVLLLNAMLTVQHKSPGSHKSLGWQQFTNAVISTISQEREGIVFLLWGRFAQQKASFIDSSKHHILTAAHPSPLARNAFSGCKHFSKTNELLLKQNQSPIDWSL